MQKGHHIRKQGRRSFLLVAFLLSLGFGNAPAQVVVIAHKSVPVDTLTRADLLDFYSGETRKWEGGAPVVVVDLKPRGEVKDTFYESILGKSPSRMKSIWLVNMLSGEGDPPEALASEEEMLARVAELQGAIGFVSEALVSDEVKVLTILD